MKRKVKITMIAHVNARDDVTRVVGSHRVAAVFDAEIEWMPMAPGYTVTGVTPNAFDEIFWQDEESDRYCRQFLRPVA